MARPRKKINFDYSVIDDAPVGMVHKIQTYAQDAGVSGPTMRSRIAEHYGNRVKFFRGRAGGFMVAPDCENVTKWWIHGNADENENDGK